MSEMSPEAENAPDHETNSETTTLRVADSWCTSITFQDGTGGTLVLDRHGVEVPATDAKRLIEQAALHGVTITEVSEK